MTVNALFRVFADGAGVEQDHIGDRFVVNGVSSLQDGMEIKPLTEAQYADKLKKTEELGEAQGDLGKLKKAFGK